MNIPVVDEQFNPATGLVEMMPVNLIQTLRDDAMSAFSMATQCSSNVVLESPVKVRTIAGFDHFSVRGEFSSGDMYGKLSFNWSVKTENPDFYYVTNASINMNDLGWCDIEYRSQLMFLERITNEYKLVLKAQKSIPKRFPEILEKLIRLKNLPMDEKTHNEVSSITDEIAELLGNVIPGGNSDTLKHEDTEK